MDTGRASAARSLFLKQLNRIKKHKTHESFLIQADCLQGSHSQVSTEMAALAMWLSNHDESFEMAMLVTYPIVNHLISEINRQICVITLRKS